MVKNSVFITTSNIGYNTGGGAVCYNICQALKKTTNLLGILGSCDAFPTDLQVPCTCIRPDCFKQPNNPFLFDYFAYWNLPKEHIDLCHMYGAPFSITAREIKKRNPDALIFIDQPAHNLELSVEEHIKMGGAYPYHHMTDPFLWPIFVENHRIADFIICPSKNSINYLRESETFRKAFGIRQKNIPIIHIPHGTLLPKKEDIKPFPEKFNVATLSQCGADKAQIYLLMAWKQLENIFPPELGYTCTVAGYGTEQWERVVKENQIKNIKVGSVKNVADVYNNCTVYVHPSVTEGWGLTVLEAMSFGRPVIVTDETGSAEAVEDGKNGFIIPIRDVNAIIGTVRWCHDNMEQTKKMGEAARKTAEKYDWSIIRKKYEAVYEAI